MPPRPPPRQIPNPAPPQSGVCAQSPALGGDDYDVLRLLPLPTTTAPVAVARAPSTGPADADSSEGKAPLLGVDEIGKLDLFA